MTHKNTQPTTEANETGLSCSSMLVNIHQYLSHHQERWTNIYNEDRHTDAGNALKEHAQGRIAAYAELKNFLLELENNEKGM